MKPTETFTTDTVRVGEGPGGWVVEFSPKGESWVDFAAWQVVGWNGSQESDGLLFSEGDCNTITSDRAKLTPTARGYIKWDGCSEWEWPTEDWHLCGVNGARERIALFKAVYDYAAQRYAPSSMSDCLKW